jgi:hypothetical protein
MNRAGGTASAAGQGAVGEGKVPKHEPQLAVELRDRGTIGNDVLQRVVRDLDLEDSRLEI